MGWIPLWLKPFVAVAFLALIPGRGLGQEQILLSSSAAGASPIESLYAAGCMRVDEQDVCGVWQYRIDGGALRAFYSLNWAPTDVVLGPDSNLYIAVQDKSQADRAEILKLNLSTAEQQRLGREPDR